MPDTVAIPVNLPGRRVQFGHGDRVLPIFWLMALALLLAALSGVALDAPAAVAAATIVLIVGGLPHGAYDIALLRRAVVVGPALSVLVIVGYAAIAGAMAIFWLTLPLLALILFLGVAAIHFGEDWSMLDEPLLRMAAGAAVLAAATLGHPAAVSRLFEAMSDNRAAWLARLLVAAAPMLLLVTGVGIVVAWRQGSRSWAAAMAACLVLLIALPPVAGFALFFVFLHSPRHLTRARDRLQTMPIATWVATGVLLALAAIAGWGVMRILAGPRMSSGLTVQSFQLLAAVALPHLLLSRWLDRRVNAHRLSHDHHRRC